MASDKLRLIGKIIALMIPFGLKRLRQLILALHHRWTYKETPTAKNVVVIGASFAGVALARRLTETLPTGYRIILIEKNSHFNFSWAFPRFSVVPGHEQHAFIPYDGIVGKAPEGIFRQVQGTVSNLTTKQVTLESGEKFDYAYLAIATGASQPLPAKVVATEFKEGAAELRSVQDNIQMADRIAVIGGGAVGIEIATDIKGFFPTKNVTLFHSRSQLLPSFGPKLHNYVLTTLEKLGVQVVLTARPEIQPGQKSILLDGLAQEFDFIVRLFEVFCREYGANWVDIIRYLAQANILTQVFSKISSHAQYRKPQTESSSSQLFRLRTQIMTWAIYLR
jgi:hypothetical protein